MRPVIPIVQDIKRVSSLSVTQPAQVSGDWRLTSLPPLSLYVHVPWCVRKCPYCDFNSHAWSGDLPEDAYLDALQADLEQALPDVWGRSIVSVFIGGGTPSLLSAAAVDRMLSMIRACLPLSPAAEITLEANPGTVEADRFKAYAGSGVNRLSLGIQSFDDRALQQLGRIHDANQARRAIALAQQAVSRVNLDLMFALPGHDLQACQQDIRTALSFGTEHLSLYNLTLEPNTVFAKYPPADLPDDDLAASMQESIADMAQQAGWERYEISAYARHASARSQHNVNYWEFGDYLGIGPGAHSKLSFHNKIVRQARLRQPESWMEKTRQYNAGHLAEHAEIAHADLPFEFMMNALRLQAGVPSHYFSERTGLSDAAIQPILSDCLAQGLLENDAFRLRATPMGWRFLNDLLARFLPDTP